MSDSALQLTLREMRSVFTSPRTLATLAIAALVLGISGPFQTYDLLPLAPRLAYWFAITFITYAVGTLCGTWAVLIAQGQHWPALWRAALIGIASGLPVTATIWFINFAAFRDYRPMAGEIISLAVYCVVISACISALFAIYGPKKNNADPAATARLLQRLPVQKRGALISLSVQDHYVEVTTDKGKSLILMRLSDAITETIESSGLQIHRSHWVAIEAVKAVHRRNGKVVLETLAGTELPVSRSYMAAVREAGLLV